MEHCVIISNAKNIHKHSFPLLRKQKKNCESEEYNNDYYDDDHDHDNDVDDDHHHIEDVGVGEMLLEVV